MLVEKLIKVWSFYPNFLLVDAIYLNEKVLNVFVEMEFTAIK